MFEGWTGAKNGSSEKQALASWTKQGMADAPWTVLNKSCELVGFATAGFRHLTFHVARIFFCLTTLFAFQNDSTCT